MSKKSVIQFKNMGLISIVLILFIVSSISIGLILTFTDFTMPKESQVVSYFTWAVIWYYLLRDMHKGLTKERENI